MAVDQNPCCRGPRPALLQTFAPGPLLQTLVADLCVEYCSLQGACRGGVCRRTPPSVTNFCREMAAQACYEANVFNLLPYWVMQDLYHQQYPHVLLAPSRRDALQLQGASLLLSNWQANSLQTESFIWVVSTYHTNQHNQICQSVLPVRWLSCSMRMCIRVFGRLLAQTRRKNTCSRTQAL